MSFVVPHRVNDVAVTNFFTKIQTAGDASSFTAEAPGRQAVLSWNAGIVNTVTGAYEYDLPFTYLVNQKQLQVFWEQNQHNQTPFVYRGWGLLLELGVAEQLPTFDPLSHPYYRELSSSRVAIYNIENLTPGPFINSDPSQPGPGANNSFVFSVPHTALPGSIRNRLIVENQGDNVGVELLGNGDGISMRSPEGKTFLIRVNEGGALTTEELR